MKQPKKEREEDLETTLGDLIEALTEEATRFVPEEKAAYVVAYILSDLLRHGGPNSESWH